MASWNILPPIPDTVGHYGENGIAFEGICGRFYGFVEYEKELPAFDVTNFALVSGPSPSYYPIDEEAARRAHEMMSFRDYQKGSKTWQYRVRVDEASMIADRQKKRIDPMYHEKVDRLLASFSRRLAENLNAESRIGTMSPLGPYLWEGLTSLSGRSSARMRHPSGT